MHPHTSLFVVVVVCYDTVDKGEPKPLDGTKIKTKEDAVAVLNKALDILCERHSRAVKEVEGVVLRAQRDVVEMREWMYELVERKYTELCEEVLETEAEDEDREGGEEEGNEGRENAEMVRLKFFVPSKCAVVWGLRLGLVCVQPYIDPPGAEELLQLV